MDERLYMVTYDISSRRRWRKVFRTMEGYGEWLQLSVFQCRLTAKRRVEMVSTLDTLIHHGDESCPDCRLGTGGQGVTEDREPGQTLRRGRPGTNHRVTEQVGGVGAMFALVAATRRALRCCGNRRQRSKCSNPLVCKRSLTNRTHSRAHDRHVEHPNPCSARNPGSISRRLKGLHESCVPRLYAAASLKPTKR